MNKRDDGGPAFPMPSGPEPRIEEITHYNEGMSLRDYFAGQALAAGIQEMAPDAAAVAQYAYALADAMIAERNK